MSFVTPLRIAAVLGFLAVALGALGAHGPLRAMLDANGRVSEWETGVLYHLIHAVVLLVLAQRAPLPRSAFGLFVAGIVFFSGSLYALALTNVKVLGAITPLGGLSLLGGWLALALKR
jgi:uncharacterized membrane protein YgdD (TMEM256/DUF423 family)